MKQKILGAILSVLVLFSFFPTIHARADVAPPQTPPGSNLNPGAETTQVRMMAETVILNVREDPQNAEAAIADTTATFTMRNLGAVEENMQARFPLSFPQGNSNGFGSFPEINQIVVKVNGKSIQTQRVMQPGLSMDAKFIPERPEIPWAMFDVTFPPGEDVTIDVAYTVDSYGYYPYEALQYILETGAGWKDTIGSADIIVRLPYEISGKNVLLPEQSAGYGTTNQGILLSGNEARWHFENLEPTQQNNIEIMFVAPALWKKVLTETDNVARHPRDGEAWGRLGKAYKEVIRFSKGFLRQDPMGIEMYESSKEAYEKCLALLPNDAQWHYGYADLLWSHYFWDIYLGGSPDLESVLPRALTELKKSLELDPTYQPAKDLLAEMSYAMPGVVKITDSGFDLLALTATPLPPTPFFSATDTATLIPTAEIVSSPIAINSPSAVTSVPTPTTRRNGSPICGGAGFILPLCVGVFLWKRRQN